MDGTPDVRHQLLFRGVRKSASEKKPLKKAPEKVPENTSGLQADLPGYPASSVFADR